MVAAGLSYSPMFIYMHKCLYVCMNVLIYFITSTEFSNAVISL